MKSSLLLDLLYPEKCVLCGKLPELRTREEEKRFDEWGLCPSCSLKPYLLPGKMSQPSDMSWGRSCFRYEGRLAQALSALKYEGMRSYGIFFGRWMLSCTGVPDLILRADAVTSVPVSKERLRRRGYNQAQILAQAAARACGVPYEELLQRIRRTSAQKNLNKAARSANLAGAFAVRTPERAPRFMNGQTVLIVDDILTTGATLTECRKVLEEAYPGIKVLYLAFSRDLLPEGHLQKRPEGLFG